MGDDWSRRSLLRRGGALGLASMLPPTVLAACSTDRPSAKGSASTTTAVSIAPKPRDAPTGLWSDAPRALTEHEYRVVEEATARLIPGPTDDPAEADSPGAREAKVTRYIDTLLSALTLSVPAVFAGGPVSDRAGSDTDDMATAVPLTTVQHGAWVDRLAKVRARYAEGVVALDTAAGGSFADATPEAKDAALIANPDGFTTMLFAHAIEGMYSSPEYGGNADGVGWRSISFPGDSQPRGYTAAQVAESDGPDVYVRAGIGDKLLTLLASTAVK